MSDKDNAISTLSSLAKEAMTKKLKKSKTYRDVKDTTKKYPSLSTLGAISTALAKKAALKIKKKINTGKDSSISLEGSYNPRTREKRAVILYKKDF